MLGSVFFKKASFRYGGVVLCLILLLSGCAGGKRSGPEAQKDVQIRLNGKWAPAKGTVSRERLIGGLMKMIKANENSEAELCTARGGGLECGEEGISWFVQGGPIPGIASYKRPYLTQVAFDRKSYDIQYKADATVRWIGTPVFCTDAVTGVSVDAQMRVTITSNTACTWTAVPHLWELTFSVEKIDFDQSLMSGHYSAVGGGAFTLGGGSGEFFLRFPKAGTLLANAEPSGLASLPSIEELPPSFFAVPLPEKEEAGSVAEAADTGEKQLWEKVSAQNTAEGFRSYLSSYPKGKYSAAAAAQIKVIEERQGQDREVALWGRIKDSTDAAVFKSYLAQHPQGLFRDAAEAKIRQLQAASVEAEAIREELALWEQVKGSADPEKIQAYLKRYPSGQFAEVARDRVRKLQSSAASSEELEFKMWTRIKDSRKIEDYQNFLQVFPQSVFSDIARSRIETLVGLEAQVAESEFWQKIRESGNPEDYREYLRRYPGGQYADYARRFAAQLDNLRAERLELEMWEAVQNSSDPAEFDRYIGAYPQGRFAEVARQRRVAAARSRSLEGVDFGRYHALVIGNNNYRHMPRLLTPLKDARSLAELLKTRYGYAVAVLADAGRKDIIDAMSRFRRELKANDNFLLYYAGHGILDKEAGRGYWLPVDAEPDSPANWISTTDISDSLKAMAAKHVIVIADSCYSGTLTRAVKVTVPSGEYLRRLASMRTRVVLSSGGVEPVIDSAGGDHSVFAGALLQLLDQNQGVIEGARLFQQLRETVVRNAPQTPEYSDILYAGHEGGDFLFVRQK